MGIKVLFTLLVITQNAMTAISKMVPAWEVPVYEEKFGANCHVESTGHVVSIDELPDAHAEYERMLQAFGAEPETKQPYMDLAYGRGRAGVRALEQAIEDAEAGEDAPLTDLNPPAPKKAAEKPAAKAVAKKAAKKAVAKAAPAAGDALARETAGAGEGGEGEGEGAGEGEGEGGEGVGRDPLA